MRNNKEIINKKDLKRLMDGATGAVVLTNNGECICGCASEILTMTTTYLRNLKKQMPEEAFKQMLDLIDKTEEEIRETALKKANDLLDEIIGKLKSETDNSDDEKENA